MVDLIEQFLFFGFELVQLDGELAVLRQVNLGRMVEGGKRTVERLDVALGQAHYLSDVLQLVAQRRDLFKIERHHAAADATAAAIATNGLVGIHVRGLRSGCRPEALACATAVSLCNVYQVSPRRLRDTIAPGQCFFLWRSRRRSPEYGEGVHCPLRARNYDDDYDMFGVYYLLLRRECETVRNRYIIVGVGHR